MASAYVHRYTHLSPQVEGILQIYKHVCAAFLQPVTKQLHLHQLNGRMEMHS